MLYEVITTKDVKAKLTIACFSPPDSEYYAKNDLEASFKKLYPNVSIEVEEYKDTSEYETAMKISVITSYSIHYTKLYDFFISLQ